LIASLLNGVVSAALQDEVRGGIQNKILTWFCQRVKYGEKCDSLCTFCLLPGSDSNCVKGIMQKFVLILSVVSLHLGFHLKIFRNVF